MSNHLIQSSADDQPAEAAGRIHRPIELMATVALALCTLVAVTAVSIGIARADVPGGGPETAPFALALFIGLLLSGMGGLTAIMAEQRSD